MPDPRRHQRSIVEGDVVLIRARVRAVYPAEGLASVRIAMHETLGGPGWRQEVVPLSAIAAVEETPPDDPQLVPRVSWRDPQP